MASLKTSFFSRATNHIKGAYGYVRNAKLSKPVFDSFASDYKTLHSIASPGAKGRLRMLGEYYLGASVGDNGQMGARNVWKGIRRVGVSGYGAYRTGRGLFSDDDR